MTVQHEFTKRFSSPSLLSLSLHSLSRVSRSYTVRSSLPPKAAVGMRNHLAWVVGILLNSIGCLATSISVTATTAAGYNSVYRFNTKTVQYYSPTPPHTLACSACLDFNFGFRRPKITPQSPRRSALCQARSRATAATLTSSRPGLRPCPLASLCFESGVSNCGSTCLLKPQNLTPCGPRDWGCPPVAKRTCCSVGLTLAV